MSILSILLKVTFVTLLGLVAVRLARRRPASVRHALLTAALLLPLLLPLITLFGPSICVIVATAPADPPSGNQPSDLIDSATSPVGQATPPRAGTTSAPAMSWQQWLVGAWAVGMAISGWPVLAGSLRVRSLRRSSLAWPEEAAFREALESARRQHSGRGAVLLLHKSVPGPITWGLLRPIVVLPADARTWPAADIERALIHEFEHIRRRDWLTQRAARLACAMYWFHPLMWVAWHGMTLEAERACDDAVINRGDAASYAEQLLRLAERQAASGRHASLLAMTGRHDLATRIHAALDQQQPRGRVGVLAATVIGLTATALVAASAPIQLVPLALPPVTGNPPQPSATDPRTLSRIDLSRKEVRMPKRSLPAALTLALTGGLIVQPQPARTQEPVFEINYNVNYAAENGLTADTDEDFIKHAVRLCAIEIQAGKLAMAKTSNAEVKAFAERLVTDHTAIARALAQWATKKNIILKDDDPSLKMKLDKHKPLETMSGADFDRAFIAAIMRDQTDGIMLVNNEKRKTRDTGLGAFAEETRLTLIAHMNVARPLRAKLY
jgi:beta-lactamase regulating signal transducer with metallopeptidase domain/predicted outer membrane protein